MPAIEVGVKKLNAAYYLVGAPLGAHLSPDFITAFFVHLKEHLHKEYIFLLALVIMENKGTGCYSEAYWHTGNLHSAK